MRAELPPNFPPLTLGIMRALAVLDQTERVSGDRKQETLTLALDELFHQFWAEHVPVHQPENLKAVLEKVLGNDKAGKGIGTHAVIPLQLSLNWMMPC